MAKLTLKRRRDEDDEDEKPKRSKKVAADTDEDFSNDEDFFGEGLAEDWADKHKAPDQQYKPEYWVSDDEEYNKIIFADTKPAFTLLVHTVAMGGNKFPKITCVRSVRPCPLCAVAQPKSAIGTSYTIFAWPVWCWRKWTDKDGNVHYVSRKFWMLPKGSTETLLKTLKKYGERATTMLFEVIKGKGKGAGFSLVGDDLSSKKQAKLEEAGDHFSKKEFMKIYAPLSDAEMEGIINAVSRNKPTASKKSKDEDDDDDLDD